MVEEEFEGGGIASKEPYRFDLMDAGALLAAANVMYETAQTGRPNNWDLLTPRVHVNHLLIHALKFMRGDRDEDHLARCICRSFMAWAVDHKRIGHGEMEDDSILPTPPTLGDDFKRDVNSGPIYRTERGGEMPMRCVYICAPLAGDIRSNHGRVVRSMFNLIREYDMGREKPLFLVPHFILLNISFDMMGEIDREWGMEMCIELVRMSDEVIVLGDTMTAGMNREVEEAQRKGIIVTRRRDL